MVQFKAKYLITGAAGQVGHALTAALGGVDGNAMPRAREALDISDEILIDEWFNLVKPDAVINCAAYTNVVMAEQNREACWRANVLGPHNLAYACAERGIPLYHISSDFVFGQDLERRMLKLQTDPTAPYQPNLEELREDMLYTESCPPGPLGFYAQTKLAGEHAVLAVAAQHPDFYYQIIRTAGVFELPWRQVNNFPYKIAAKLMRDMKKQLTVVSDVYTNLCAAEDLAKVLAWMVENRDLTTMPKAEPHSGVATKPVLMLPKGVYHVTNGGVASWYEVAQRIARNFMIGDRVVPVTKQSYAVAAGVNAGLTPSFTCLSGGKLAQVLPFPMPSWISAVDRWTKRAKGYFK